MKTQGLFVLQKDMSEINYQKKEQDVDGLIEQIDKVEESEYPIHFEDEPLHDDKKHKVLSLLVSTII